jgi:hypothetical protein
MTIKVIFIVRNLEDEGKPTQENKNHSEFCNLAVTPGTILGLIFPVSVAFWGSPVSPVYTLLLGHGFPTFHL